MFSKIKNILPKYKVQNNQSVKSDVKDVTPDLKFKVKDSKYKGAYYGAMFGVGAGIGDGIVTVLATKKDIKRALENYKTCNFETKKQAIQKLHESGFKVKEYKEFIQKVMNKSVSKVALKRAAIYGAVIASLGFVMDLVRNNKEKVDSHQK